MIPPPSPRFAARQRTPSSNASKRSIKYPLWCVWPSSTTRPLRLWSTATDARHDALHYAFQIHLNHSRMRQSWRGWSRVSGIVDQRRHAFVCMTIARAGRSWHTVSLGRALHDLRLPLLSLGCLRARHIYLNFALQTSVPSLRSLQRVQSCPCLFLV